MIKLSTNEKTLFILPHLDDEFALAPLIKSFVDANKENCFFLYCAEEILNPNRLKRRSEALAVMDYFNVKVDNILFMNDYFSAESRKLYEVFHSAQFLMETHVKKWQVKQIVTLGFEGGHPDHDVIAILAYQLKCKLSLNVYYAPAYNRHTVGPFFRIQVCRPLPTQKHLFHMFSINMYAWTSALKIAYLYRSQFKTFIILVPFILNLVCFRHYIFLSKELEISSVDWPSSLSNLRYATDIEVIESILNDVGTDK